MSDFCYKPFCECNFEYIMSWFFFIIGNGFLLYMIFINPIGLDYGKEKRSIQFIFSCASFIVVSLITRCLCKSKKKFYTSDRHNNILKYGSV